MFLSKQKGFTLIELVVVIIILGILAVVAAPKFINLEDDATEAAVLTQFAAFKSAVSLYHTAWLTGDHHDAVNNLPTFGNGTVDSTDKGWPYATSGIDTPLHTACGELWTGLTDTDLTNGAVPDTELATTKTDIAYTYMEKPRTCIYRMVHHIQREQTTKVMRYDLDNGKVWVDNAFYNKDGTPG